MAAARSGKVDALAALLGHDAAVNARDELTQQTALMWAARSDHRGGGAGFNRARRGRERAARASARLRRGGCRGAGGGPGAALTDSVSCAAAGRIGACRTRLRAG